MKKNVIASTLSGSSKIFLLICLASAFAADLAVFALLLVQDVSASYWIFPLLFLLADALFMAQAAFSNFRFAYTVWQIAIWCVLTAVMLICTVALNVFGDVTVFTNAAAAILIAFHAVILLAVITCYLYASRRISGGKPAQTAVAVLATVISVALVAFYGAFLGFGGFFGQGNFGVRPLTYVYDSETQGYEAVGVVGTKGDTLIVPEEFNGEKVTKISAGLFYETGVSDVYLECSPDVEITNAEECYTVRDGLTVYASKKHIDEFKNKFYDIARSRADADGLISPALGLANATVPYDLEGDEVYVTFAYGYDSFKQAEKKPLSTWFGKKGESVNLGYFKDIPYAKHANRLSDEDLYWCYNNTEGKVILSDFTVDGKALGSVNESVTASVSFEKVFRIVPGESNDWLHPADTEFTYSTINGGSLGCKYTTAQNADKIIAPYKRDGFSLGWNYSSESAAAVSFTSLSEALEGFNGSELYINPVWEMNKPELILKTNCGNSAVYGDDVIFTAEATPPAAGFRLDCVWTYGFSSTPVGYGTTYKKEGIKRDEAGNYSVKVTASYSGGSSLTSQAGEVVNVSVNRRPVELEWGLPSGDLVYDKNVKTVTCAIKEDSVLSFGGVKDRVQLKNGTFEYTNAGTHVSSAELVGQDYDNYYISASETKATLIIKQAPLAVTVTAGSKYYDGEYVYPAATATGYVDAADKANVQLYAEGNGASAGIYKTGAHLGTNTLDKNYYIDVENSVFPTYEIYKQPVDLTWSISGGDGFIYDGTNHLITINAVGTQGGKLNEDCSSAVSTLNRYLTDAGVHNISAYLLNSNYVINSGETHTFTINKRVVSDVKRRNADFAVIYNGTEQAPDYVIEGVGRDAGRTIYVNGRGGVHAGTNTFTPLSIENNYAGNYELDLTATYNLTYEIKPANIYISWKNQSYTYDGKAHMPEAECYGASADGYLKFELSRTGDGINAGSYKVTAKLLNGEGAEGYLATDYNVLGGSTAYMTIRKAELTVRAKNNTLKAGEVFTLDSLYEVSGFVNGENAESTKLKITVLIAGHVGATSLPEGVYDIQFASGSTNKNNYEIKYVFGKLTVTA